MHVKYFGFFLFVAVSSYSQELVAGDEVEDYLSYESTDIDPNDPESTDIDPIDPNDPFLANLFDQPEGLGPSDDDEYSELADTEMSESELEIFNHCVLCSFVLDVAEEDVDEFCASRPPLNEKCEMELAEEDMAGVRGEHIDEFAADLNKILEKPPCLVEEDPSCAGRASLRDPYALWPRATVPYTLSAAYSNRDRNAIMAAFQKIESKTCIKFKKRTSERSYIKIAKFGGCYSFVGRQPISRQPQRVSLSSGCMRTGTIMHELMHALGFYHEQSRDDRDQWLKVQYQNVREGKQHNFKKYNLLVISHLGTTYDFDSVMHYGPTSFSANRQATLVPYINGQLRYDIKIGQRTHLSETDILELNRLYSCPDKKQMKTTTRAPLVVGKRTIIQRTRKVCVDRASWCPMWAKHNFCGKYKFMQKHCLKSCKNFCK